VALPAVILLSLVGGFLVARRALSPVQIIIATAKRISAEGLNQRLPVPAARDEIRMLSEVLNEAFGRLETSYQQAIHFASDASHQLKTPITVMRAGIEMLMKQPGQAPDNLMELADLLQQTRRLSSLAEGLLLLARADAGRLAVKPQATDLVQVIEGCIEDAEILAEPRQLCIERELPAHLPCFVDAPRFEQALLNLLENAVKYNRPGGTIRVSASVAAGGISIVVANTGAPIPSAKIPLIFNRFVRGENEEALAGHGLGLAIARELVRAQGGELRLVRSDVNGTEFELRLPAPLALA
jgi:signal transduction histidine kinase